MMFLNEYEVNSLASSFDPENFPNLAAGAKALQRLMRWVNANGDGWAYWQPPLRAAGRLMELLQEGVPYPRRDVTSDELKRACTPIKSFLTHQGVTHGEVFDESPEEMKDPYIQFPVPGTELLGGIVVASTWYREPDAELPERRFTALLLMPEPPFYRVGIIVSDPDGTSWETVEEFRNIVFALNGYHDHPGYIDLGGDV